MYADATIRLARSEDADELAQTAVAAWREGFRGIVPDRVDPEEAWRPDRIRQRLDDPGYHSAILAAEVDGHVRGMLLFGPSRDAGAAASEAEIVALYVHPDHWRGGVGRRLVLESLERLRAAGFTEVIVWTLAKSPRNLAFYASLGFAQDGGTQRRPSFGSPLEVRFRMRLRDAAASDR